MKSSTRKPASIVTVRSGATRAKGLPWRTDVTIQPQQTLAVEPDAPALSREDRELLEREPIDPTTRKATAIAPPETGWTLDDLIEDRRLADLGC